MHVQDTRAGPVRAHSWTPFGRSRTGVGADSLRRSLLPLASFLLPVFTVPQRLHREWTRLLTLESVPRTDFNNANMTNVYTVKGDGEEEVYTPFFAAAGFRYAQLSGFPPSFTPALSTLTALSTHTDVPSASKLTMPVVSATNTGTTDVLNRIHALTRAAQTSNLFSIPTDWCGNRLCLAPAAHLAGSAGARRIQKPGRRGSRLGVLSTAPSPSCTLTPSPSHSPQRERRGWMGDAQSTSDEAVRLRLLRCGRTYLCCGRRCIRTE